jgi:hypothetical protein
MRCHRHPSPEGPARRERMTGLHDGTFAPFHRHAPGVTMKVMSLKVPTGATASTEWIDTAHAVTYLVAATEDGDLETGAVLLDGRPIGRLSHRRGGGAVPRTPFESLLAPDSTWHAEAVGWIPHSSRPWDTRITTSAPTRRRAAEDLLRAYRNHR